MNLKKKLTSHLDVYDNKSLLSTQLNISPLMIKVHHFCISIKTVHNLFKHFVATFFIFILNSINHMESWTSKIISLINLCTSFQLLTVVYLYICKWVFSFKKQPLFDFIRIISVELTESFFHFYFFAVHQQTTFHLNNFSKFQEKITSNQINQLHLLIFVRMFTESFLSS